MAVDRLGDADPQPARALARGARARRGRTARREGDHARGRLRRAIPRRRQSRSRLLRRRSPRISPAGLGRGGPRAPRPDAPDRRAPRALHAPARLRLEPRTRGVACVAPDADPGDRSTGEADREQACGPGRSPRRAGAVRSRGRRLRALGDNTGCMALKGARRRTMAARERPDRWALTPAQAALAERWGIAPERDLRHAAAAA